jgi:hypothetical protein
MTMNAFAVKVGTTLGRAARVSRPSRLAIKQHVSAAADVVDGHLAHGVESFVSYMDKHPGFSAVLAPTSVLRRIAYRQTEDTIIESRKRTLIKL